MAENATAQARSTIGEGHQRDQDQTQDPMLRQKEGIRCQNSPSVLSAAADNKHSQSISLDTIYHPSMNLRRLCSRQTPGEHIFTAGVTSTYHDTLNFTPREALYPQLPVCSRIRTRNHGLLEATRRWKRPSLHDRTGQLSFDILPGKELGSIFFFSLFSFSSL